MPGPPKDVSPSELWTKLSEARPNEEIDFPRKNSKGQPIGRLRIQVLQMEDYDIARLKANQALKTKAHTYGLDKLEASDMASEAVKEVLGDLSARELLVRACLSDTPTPETADTDRPFYPQVFRDADALGAVVGPDEIRVLFTAYELIQFKYGPFEKTIQDKGDLDAWVARLAEDLDDPLVIGRMSLPQLAEVTTSLSERLYTLSTILRSQWESLPPTLASQLEPYCLGMSFFGTPPAAPEETGSQDSESLSDDKEERTPVGIPADRPITAEDAARIAERMRGGS
jgi:hypothetical protein